MSSIANPLVFTGAAALENDLQTPQHIDLSPAFRDDLTSFNGPSIAFGIVLAGGAYPIVLSAIYLVFVVAFLLWHLLGVVQGTHAWEPGLVPLTLPFFALTAGGVGAVIGCIWAAMTSLVILPIIYLFVRSLNLRGSLVWLGAVAGGLVGFIAILPLTFTLSGIGPSIEFWPILFVLALGPGLATILGQLGGAWGGQRAARFGATGKRKATLTQAGAWQAPTDSVTNDVPPATEADQPPLQFRIRHMLWIFVWFSLLLSVIRLSGIPYELVLPVLLGWLAYQSATLYAGSRIFKRLAARAAACRQPFHVEPLAN